MDGNIPGNAKDSTSVNMDGIMLSHEQKRTTGSSAPLGMENDELGTDDDKAEVRGMPTSCLMTKQSDCVDLFSHFEMCCLSAVVQ